MSLGSRQREFTKAVGLLIAKAYDLGYELTFGDAYATTGHSENSFHYKRLAIDLNLFRNSVWLKYTEDHLPLGEYWEAIGGTWGGRFEKKDGNHYSWGES